jgi:hypothetical protein
MKPWLGVIAAITCAGAAHAADPVVNTANLQTYTDAFTSIGYTVTPGTWNNGDPTLTVAKDGWQYALEFYNCTATHTDCQSMKFTTGWNGQKGVTIQGIYDNWNAKYATALQLFPSEPNDRLDAVAVETVGPGDMSRTLFLAEFARWVADDKNVLSNVVPAPPAAAPAPPATSPAAH